MSKYPTRKNMRLPHYDYSQNGAYFITVCTQHRVIMFGDITNGEMCANPAGKLVEEAWNFIPSLHADYHLVEFQLMPNHIHGILLVMESDESNQVNSARRNSIGTVIQRFKMYTTSQYIEGVKARGWKPFPGRLWQRGYYEHVIRNEVEMYELRKYVRDNPLKWHLDELNSERTGQ